MFAGSWLRDEDRERERDTHTDRLMDGKRDRNMDRERYGHLIDSYLARQLHKQIDRCQYIYIYIYICMYRQIYT